MGIQYPLTATALGRSPYDDVFEGTGSADLRYPPQQFDQRGRPINPDSKRINRQIVRAHNEVMQVVGVAEPENSGLDPELESLRKHDAQEEQIGRRLDSYAKRCIEMVGLFGIHGLRQRILIYRQYSQIQFWHLWQKNREFSWKRDIFAGAAVGLLSNTIDRRLRQIWLGDESKLRIRRVILDVWAYVGTHVKYFAIMQRLGLISADRWLPHPAFFIPFTKHSPVPAPPPLQGFDSLSLLRWTGHAIANAAPFFLWVVTLRLAKDLQPKIWSRIYKNLPSTAFLGRRLPILPPLRSSAPSPSPDPAREVRTVQMDAETETAIEPLPSADPDQGSAFVVVDDSQAIDDASPAENREPQSTPPQNQEDDSGTDEDEGERINTTLISFDVEDTEAGPDAPPGLWSAELRPSQATESKCGANQPVYLDTFLTQLPALVAASMYTDTAVRLLMTAHEAIALRLIARFHRLRHGLPCDDIYLPFILRDLSWHAVTNLLGVELLYFVISGEIWAVVTGLSQHFHMTDKEWKEAEKEAKAREEEEDEEEGLHEQRDPESYFF